MKSHVVVPEKNGTLDAVDKRFPIFYRKRIKKVPIERVEPEVDGELDKHADLCCCRCVRLRTGTIIIAILELLLVILQLVDLFYLISTTSRANPVYLIIGFSWTILAFVAIILLFCALKTGRHYLLIPHLVLQVIVFLVLLAIITFVILNVIWGFSILLRAVVSTDSQTRWDSQRAGHLVASESRQPSGYFAQSPLPPTQVVVPFVKYILLAIAGALIVVTLVHIWLTTIVWRYYKRLKTYSAVAHKTDTPRLSNDYNSIQ